MSTWMILRSGIAQPYQDRNGKRTQILALALTHPRLPWPLRCASLGGFTRLPIPATVEEQVDAIISPAIEFGSGHWCPEAQGAALWHCHQEGKELLGSEFRTVDRKSAGAGLAL